MKSVHQIASEVVDAWPYSAKVQSAHKLMLIGMIAEKLSEDAERLEWLMRKVSGAEFSRIGVNYGANCGRDHIDTAMKEETK